jgi:hypothetical protein
MSRSKLIVLSGEAGAGKDSIAKLLVEQHGWQLYSLAVPLKRFVADMFGFTDEQLYGPSSARNAPDPRWAGLKCPTCSGRGERVHVACERCNGKGEIEISPRTTLQPLGYEYLHHMVHPDVLTRRATPDIKALLDAGTSVVVNDARFQVDRDNLHDWLGGCRVNVSSVRTQGRKEKEAWRKHKGENDLPTDESVEYVIHNDEKWPFPALGSKVDAMLQELFG